jgi:endonuclease I
MIVGCGRKEESGFEPAHGKGAAARATLYFLLRYQGQIGSSPDEFLPDRLETLLRWHEAEPPGLWERHRNAAIHAKQGNRNPLIDFPELARDIEFRPAFQ